MLWKWCMDDIKMSFWDEKEAKRLFQKLQFHNTVIKKSRIKHLKNINLLHELSFYNELSIKQVSKAFKKYVICFKIWIIDSNDPFARLEASKSSLKGLLKDLLDEVKGFKYQITVKVLLRKHKESEDIEFVFVYFNSTTKTIISSKYMLINRFKKFYIE